MVYGYWSCWGSEIFSVEEITSHSTLGELSVANMGNALFVRILSVERFCKPHCEVGIDCLHLILYAEVNFGFSLGIQTSHIALFFS